MPMPVSNPNTQYTKVSQTNKSFLEDDIAVHQDLFQLEYFNFSRQNGNYNLRKTPNKSYSEYKSTS